MRTSDDERARRLGHDLRNIMSPAMIMADLISTHPDPAVRRAAEVILTQLDKATAAIRASAESERLLF